MRRQAGLSYVEALLAVLVLALTLVPALETLRSAFTGAAVGEDVVQSEQRLATRLEAVLAEPFANLSAAADGPSAPSSYSDAAGGPGRLLVFLSRYDGDNADGNGNPFDGTDAGLLWVRVAIDNTPFALTTLVAQ